MGAVDKMEKHIFLWLEVNVFVYIFSKRFELFVLTLVLSFVVFGVFVGDSARVIFNFRCFENE